MAPQTRNSNESCPLCSRKVTDSCKALHCDLCSRWSHQTCENVTDSTYNAITNCKPHEHVAWYCKLCSGAALPIHKKLAALEVKVNKLEANAVTKEHVTNIVKESIDEKVEDVKTNLETTLKPLVTPIAKSEVRECVQEFQEISKRENNIVIHKLKEEEGKSSKEQALSVLKVCSSETSMEDILDAKRMGERKDNQTRPLLVRLNSRTKENTMKNLRKLKHSEFNISITHDLPPRTREHRKKLMDEAKEATGNNQDDFLFKFVGPLGMESVKTIRKEKQPQQ